MKNQLILLYVGLGFSTFIGCGDDEKSDDTNTTEDTSSPVDTNDEDTNIEDSGLLEDTSTEDSASDETDIDSDGYSIEDGDCNDEDPSIYPGAPEDYTDGIDQDCDGYADVGDADCSAQFVIFFEGLDTNGDGSADTSQEINLDFCRKWSMNNTYEYDPDTPPELNSLSIDLNATDDSDFQCQILIDQSGVCGEGYYRMGNETGNTYYASMDCSGVLDENEKEFIFTDGYLRLDSIDTGSIPGSFFGEPLKTNIAGFLNVWSTEVTIEGDLEITSEQLAGDQEENICATENEDEDGDSILNQYYGGTDCDDNDSSLLSQTEDNDCDGVLTSEDCDDNDTDLLAQINDVDCDGILTSDDCNDNDPTSTIIAEDADCDGVFTSDDCNDNDPNSLNDMDCDGTIAIDDCDDNNSSSTIIAEDADCDGVLTSEDCDDNDPSNTSNSTTDTNCNGIIECTDSCLYANDGICDDGGPNSSYDLCSIGTDCTDCGTR